jgi:hypothetical protein
VIIEIARTQLWPEMEDDVLQQMLSTQLLNIFSLYEGNDARHSGGIVIEAAVRRAF